VSPVRHRAVRAPNVDLSSANFLLHNPGVHKQVVNHLFASLMASEYTEEEIALEFWRAYRHLIENLPLSSLPLRLLDKVVFLAFVAEVKAAAGECVPSDPGGEFHV
jgi:hypothetical protein